MKDLHFQHPTNSLGLLKIFKTLCAVSNLNKLFITVHNISKKREYTHSYTVWSNLVSFNVPSNISSKILYYFKILFLLS